MTRSAPDPREARTGASVPTDLSGAVPPAAPGEPFPPGPPAGQPSSFDPPGSYEQPGDAAVETPDGQTSRQHPAPGFNEKGKVATGKISGLWVGLILAAVFVILLVIFIAQNSRQTSIHFLGWSGHFNVALALLLAAVAGILLVAIPGSVRILQLRRALRKNVPTEKRR